MRIKRWILLISLLALLGTTAAACGPTGAANQAVSIDQAWARPGLAGGNSAIYFTIQNGASTPETLKDAKCPSAMMVQVHKSSIDASGNASMEHQTSVVIPAGGEVQFQPGGLHVMLMDLKQELKAGDQITVTLVFEKSGEIQLPVTVREQ